MSEWKEYVLEDCMEAIIDYRGKTPCKTTYGVPLITARIVKNGRIETPNEFIAEEDYDNWMTRGLPQINDLIMTTEAPLGEVASIDEEYIALAQRVILLRGKKELLDNIFLRFLFQTPDIQNQLYNRATGTTVLGIKQSELRKITLPLPPLPVQKRIAEILGSLDEKIELNRRTRAMLEQMAQALFRSWFVDFDPVKAKAAGKRPKGLSPEVARLFPKEFEESPLGPIPKGWSVGNVGDYVDTVSITHRFPDKQIIFLLKL